MKKILIILLGIFLIQQSFTYGTREESADDGKLNIVTTIGMIADVASIIGGDAVKVTPLMGAGIDPHLYKASAGDIRRLSNAELILFNGLHLESKMGEVLEKMDGRIAVHAVGEVVDLSRLDKPDSFEGYYDPHIWFDVTMWKSVARAIKDAIIAEIPDRTEYIETNFNNYAAEMDSLDEYIKNQVLRIAPNKRILVTAHDAFHYFGRAYDMEVKGLQGISTATEAGTDDMQKLADFIAERQIPAVFIESSVPRKNIEALQAAVRSRGFDVLIGGELYSDAMGDPGTKEGTYLGMVKHNIDTIVKALGE